MFGSWSNMAEIRHLDPARRKAAWQAGYGAVSGGPVFWLAAGSMAVPVGVFAAIGGALVPGWIGNITGIFVGVMLGGFLSDAIMRRAMRPHILEFLAKGPGHE